MVALGDPLLIWGAGAVGGTLGAYLARAGHEVLLVDQVAEHVTVCREQGLSVEGPLDNFTVPVAAFTPAELKRYAGGPYRRAVLAVKAQHTETRAGRAGPASVGRPGRVCPVGPERPQRTGYCRHGRREHTVGCFVNFSADWLAPGRILYGNRGAVVVGEIDRGGAVCDRTRALHALLQSFEPDAILTDDIWGYLWGKLATARCCSPPR